MTERDICEYTGCCGDAGYLAWFENYLGHCGRPFLFCDEHLVSWQFWLSQHCEETYKTPTVLIRVDG